MHKCGITDTFFAKHLWNSKSSVNDCCFLSLLFLFSTASDYISLSRCKVYTCRNYWTQWSAWFCVRSGKKCNERINHVPLFSLTHTCTHAHTHRQRQGDLSSLRILLINRHTTPNVFLPKLPYLRLCVFFFFTLFCSNIFNILKHLAHFSRVSVRFFQLFFDI